MRRLVLVLVAYWGLLGDAWATPAVEVYGRLPSVELMRLSPSGDRYAFIAVVGESRKLCVLTFEGKALFVAAVGDVKVRDIDWASEDHLLVALSSTVDLRLDFGQNYELSTVLNLRLQDKRVEAIFEKTRSVVNTVRGYFGSTRVDDHSYGYFGGITYVRDSSGDYVYDHGYRDLYRVDLDTTKATLVAKGGEKHHDWVLASDGTVVAHSEYDQKTSMWRLYAGEDRKRLLLEKKSPTNDIALAGQGRVPGTVLVDDSTGDADLLEELSVTDGKRTPIFDDLTLTGLLSDPLSGRLLGALTQDEPGATFFDRSLQARFIGTRKAFPGLQVHLESFSRDLARLIVKTDGRDDSGTFWLVDIASGSAEPLGYAYPEIRRADVGSTQLVRYSAADGLPIEGVLTLPPGKKPEKLPLVVMPHGGPIDVRDRLGFDWWAQAYAAAGYAVFQPNYRGSSGYGREFRRAGFGQWGRKMQTDLSDGVAALAEQGVIDPKRACIVGASYGGYAALAGVTLQHDLYRCAVSVGGISDLSSFFGWQIDRHGYRSDATRYWHAVIGADKDGDVSMRDISPARFAKKADAPVLLLHGKDDTVVPVEQSEKMASALKRADKPVDFVVMKGEDHWLSREATRMTMLKASIAFVQEHNPAD